MRILIVEDESSARHLLKSFLSPYGECDSVETGEEALEKISQSIKTSEPYTLVCLDIKLPGIDGLETLREIRQEEETNSIYPGKGAKIVMTTAVDEKDKIIKAFNEQCEVYLTKPISKDRLDEKLRELDLI